MVKSVYLKFIEFIGQSHLSSTYLYIVDIDRYIENINTRDTQDLWYSNNNIPKDMHLR